MRPYQLRGLVSLQDIGQFKERGAYMKLKKIIKGRCGNQFFQYAFMRAVQENYAPRSDLVLVFKKDEDYLQYFRTRYKRAVRISITPAQFLVILQLCMILWFYKCIIKTNFETNRYKIEQKFQKRLIKNNIIWLTSGYHNFDFTGINWEKDVVFYGHFESPLYFDGISDAIREELAPQCFSSIKNAEIYKKIIQSNSVCMHVRRGDFVGTHHEVCSSEYYNLAIAKIQSLVKNPLFVVFSDEPDWVHKNIHLPEETIFETGDEWIWEVHHMMRACKHFIISNSTFSWWAQYLTNNKDSIVVAPDRWRNNDAPIGLYQDSWILEQS